jgi:DNA polymerase
VNACQPWVTEELRLIRPRVLVCLGATATRSLLGLTVKVLRDRGRLLDSRWAQYAVVTVHPSAVLRAPDESRAEMRAALASDLSLAASVLERQSVESLA